ncbi:MAG: ATP-binding protein [Oscillospiraceae bacterium]
MTKRIFRSILLVSLIILLSGLVLVTGVLYEYFTASQQNQLETETALAVRGVSEGGMAYLEALELRDCRVTLVAADGRVLFDNVADAASMENHADRPEIKSALESGSGEGARDSATLLERQFYCARRLPDGSVLRLSGNQYTPFAFLLMMTQPILVIVAAAFILSFILASRLAKRIVRPLNALDLDSPLENDTYEELAPLLSRIEHQHREIDAQSKDLARRQNELEAVTGSMNEGLILLNAKGVILTINDSAARIFGADAACVGRDILTLHRSLSMRELLDRALGGAEAELTCELSGGTFQLNASPVFSAGVVSGAALLIFDVTAKTRAEQMRREFTANVSHELKTPIHSISGCAELLQSGLVKPEDERRFTQQIYFEAQRMTRLVDDIIGLSRLDEGGEDLQREPTDLVPLAEEVLQSLKPAAAQRSVTLSLNGDVGVIDGVPQLLSGIIFNLCDNAIKYNREGGSVTVSIGEDENAVTLSVADTGIGIPQEHLSRVFERFYRVDKSHSKEIGGTGLGLSIVKHAALLHNADLDLQSTLGEGTTITLRLPK